MSTRISIVIPTFNRAKLLPRAIDSALSQTVPVEVIVCDHGSSDETPQVAASYGPRIRYIRRDQDRGPIVCWRDGIEHASGELVHINYDDDWIEPEFSQRTAALLTDDVAFVYTRACTHSPEGQPLRILSEHPAGIRPIANIVHYLLRAKLTISPGCALFRRSDLLKNLLLEIPGAKGVYGKNSGVGEDLLLFLLTSLDYPHYAHIAEPLAHFLAHPASITVGAQESGRMTQLVDAYAVAKQYYRQQPGSIAPAQGLGGRLLRARWKLASRGFL